MIFILEDKLGGETRGARGRQREESGGRQKDTGEKTQMEEHGLGEERRSRKEQVGNRFCLQRTWRGSF